jgi:PTS system cellobiose-specific IIC component
MNKIIQKIVAFTQMRYMRIITNGFMAVAALSIAGSLFTLIKSFPIGPWQDFLTSSGLGDVLSIPISITTDAIAVYVVLAMACETAKEFKKDRFQTSIIALGAFFMLTPFTGKLYSEDYTSFTEIPNVIPVSSIGAQGIFLAIIVGICAARLYIYFLDKGWTIKMPASVPGAVGKMFEMMIPGGLVFLIFLLIRWGFSLTMFETAQQFIYGIMQAPLMHATSGAGGILVFLLVEKFLWLFGVHGGMVAYSAMAGVINTVNAENMAAYAAGTPVPHMEWAYMNLLMDFSILPLTLIMLKFAKSDQYKALAKVSLPTSLFNITEPIVFGFPMIMNPIMAVPFVGLQLINFLLTVGVTKIGLLAAPTGVSVSTMLPTPVIGAMLNSSWTGAVWAVILIVIDMLVWYPFFRVADKKALEEEKKNETAVEAKVEE